MADISTISAIQTRPLMGSITSHADAGEAMAVGNVVRATATGVVKARANTSAGCRGKLGVIVAGEGHDADGDIASGERVTVLWFGRLYCGQNAALDPTKQYFLSSATAGKFSDTVGTYERNLGYPETAEIFFFNPDSEQPESS